MSMKNKIFLVQTDTTIGFLSKDESTLNKLKQRPLNTPCVLSLASFKELQNFTRVPHNFKNLIRKARKTSFIYPNKKAIRVVKDCKHSLFLKEHGPMFSSSANKHNQKFNEEWAKSVADKIVGEIFFETKPSRIFKLSLTKLKKLR